jgi:hypothetical protein
MNLSRRILSNGWPGLLATLQSDMTPGSLRNSDKQLDSAQNSAIPYTKLLTGSIVLEACTPSEAPFLTHQTANVGHTLYVAKQRTCTMSVM